MSPVTVKQAAPKKDGEKQDKKKGLVDKLLSLLGLGGKASATGAAGAAGAASTGMGVAQVATVGATAGGGLLKLLSTAKGLAAVLGGGAAVVSVGMLGSQMFGGPSIRGLTGQGFSSQQRAARNVDAVGQPQSHLMSFNEGIRAQGEGDDSGDGSGQQAAKASVSDAQPGAPAAAAYNAPKTDNYGNPLSAMKNGFGESNNIAGGFGGGGGGFGGGAGGSKAGAEGLGSAGAFHANAGARGNSAAMANASGATVSSRSGGRAVTNSGNAMSTLKAAAGLSKAATMTSNYQTANYTAGRAFHGTSGNGAANASIGANGGVMTGAGLTGAAANLAGNPNTVSKNVTPPAAASPTTPNKSCSDGSPTEPNAAAAGLDSTSWNQLVTDCKNQQQLKMDLIWLLGGAVVACLLIGQLSNAGKASWGIGYISACILTAGVLAMVGFMLAGGGPFGDGLIKMMSESSSLMMECILEIAAAAAVAVAAVYALATGWALIGGTQPAAASTAASGASGASGAASGGGDSFLSKVGTGVATSVATSTITNAMSSSSPSAASSSSAPAAAPAVHSGGGSSAAAAPAAVDATPAAAPAPAVGQGSSQAVATNTGTGTGNDVSNEMAQMFGGPGSNETIV